MAASTVNMPESKILVSAVSGTSLVRTRPIFGPESKCLFCCSESLIKVYSVESGECIRNLDGHTNTVTGIIVNPNNKLQILSCSTDQTIIQWDYSDGVLLRIYQLHHPLYHIDFYNSHESSSLILKRQISRQEFDIVECNLPTKKDGTPQIKSLLTTNKSNNTNSVAVGCQNKVIAVVNRNVLVVHNKKKTIRHIMEGLEGTQFTCVACHPTDLCVVTGCQNGRIYYWYNIFNKDKVTKTYYHWHALPVLDLCFTAEGSYLLSGGYECVLVKWQYNSNLKDFLPRLGAPINHVTCSRDNLFYATCHTDNVIQLINNNFELKQVYQGLTCAHHETQKTHPVPAGLHYDPRSKALVTNGKIGHLQFYSLANDKHLYNLDIVSQNYVSPENLDKQMTVTEIIAADFSSHGDWLSTVEMWDDKVMSPEMRLKFWKFKEETQSYTLNTTVEMPHNKAVTCVRIRPETGEDDDQPMVVTTSQDGYFKTWTLVDDSNIYRQNTKWNCTFSGYYRGQTANIASYSEDGSLLCVGFGPVLTIWDPDTNVLLQTLANYKDKSDIKFIEFGKYGCSHLLVVCSKEGLTTWNLSTCTVVWSVEIESVCLVPDPETDVMAVISQHNNVYFFRPSSPDMLYKHDMISSTRVASAIFIPQTSNMQGRQLPTNSKLYFINCKHQLLCLSEVNSTQTTQKNKMTITSNLPKTALSSILSKETSKQPILESHSSSKDVKSWKEFLDTPPQVQPAVTSLCQQFIQSMLVKSGAESVDDIEEDAESSDVESVMEVDQDSDSEDEKVPVKQTSTKTRKSEPENLKTKSEIQKDKSQTVKQTDSKSQTMTDDTVLNINDMDWYRKKIH